MRALWAGARTEDAAAITMIAVLLWRRKNSLSRTFEEADATSAGPRASSFPLKGGRYGIAM